MNTKEWDGCRNPSGAGVKLWMGLKSVKSGWNEHFFGRLALPRIWISSWMGHMACRSCVEELEVGFCSSFLIASIMNCREVFVLSSFHISQPQQARFVVTTVTLQCIEQHCWVDGRQFQWGRKRKTCALAMAARYVPGDALYAQFCHIEHRESWADQSQPGHRGRGGEGFVEQLWSAKHLPAE